jgi:hypothetical protein
MIAQIALYSRNHCQSLSSSRFLPGNSRHLMSKFQGSGIHLIHACESRSTVLETTAANETAMLGFVKTLIHRRNVMRSMRRKTMIATLAILLASAATHAQSTFGSIVGTVRDQSGAQISQTTITLKNLDDNSVQVKNADDAGEYVFLNLKPGHYEVIGEKSGFNRAQINGILLDARQERRVNLLLPVRTNTEIIEVTADTQIINTENATIGDSKDGAQVAELPVNYRGATTSPLAALVAVPGVQQDSSGNISIGGGLPSTIDFSLDGISTSNVRETGPNQNMYPSSELISEFKVSAVDNNAEFAQVGDVTVTTKSGSNKFHGSAFEYAQNAAFDAETYNAPDKQKKVDNTFGASLGGPVVLGSLYNGRDHTFFFADYEGNTIRATQLQEDYVPTAGERAGQGSTLAGGSVTNINQVAQKVLQYYPLPNFTSGGDDHYYLVNRAAPSTTKGVDGRLDRIINSKQQAFARWSWKELSNTAWQGASSTAQSTLLPASTISETNNNFILSHSYVITPSLLNEFRFGASLWKSGEKFPLNGVATDTNLGLTGLDLTQHPESGAFPVFNFSAVGFTPIGRQKDGNTISTTYEYTDNLSKTLGHHAFKFGIDYRRLGYKDVEHFAPADDFGAFNFYGEYSGNAFQDFLLGVPNDNEVAVTGPNLDSRAQHLGLYAQDEYRLSPKITISYGLRWEFHPPFTEQKGNLANFDPVNDDVIIPDHALAPATAFLESINYSGNTNYQNPSISQQSNVITASQAHVGQGLRSTYYKNFDPRIGIAYRPFGDSKTVLRAGFGIFTASNLGPQSFLLSGISTASFIDYANFPSTSTTPLYTLPQAVPTISSGANPLESTIGSEDFEIGIDLHLRDAESAQWNVTAEHEFPGDYTVRTSYIGMNSYRLMNVVDLNQVRPSSTPYSTSEKPFQNWGQVFNQQNNAGANYQSLQVQADHPAKHGLYLQATYTLAKNLTNAEGTGPSGFPGMWGSQFTDRFHPRLDRGNDYADRRHRVLVSGIYQLPVGHGHRFLSDAHGLEEALLGGWKLSTISLLQTGPFQTPTYVPSTDPLNINLLNSLAVTNLNGGLPPIRPDRIGNGNLAHHTPGHWYDSSAFQAIPDNAGREGTAGVGILEGPGTIAIAGGLAKEFVIGEGVKARFESTFTNLLNHPNFAAPSTVWTSPSFGVTNTVQTAENAGNRTGQLALRIEF